MPSDWQQNLQHAVRAAQAQVIGWQHIEYMHHARLVAAALKAFGDDTRALFFIEELAGNGRIPRPDLIVLHPRLGVVVIENKGVQLADIVAVRNTTLQMMRSGILKSEDPYYQAEKVLLRLRDLMERRVPGNEALFVHTAALPAIDRNDFQQRFNCALPPQTLFADAIANPDVLRAQLTTLCDQRLRQSGRNVRLTHKAHTALRNVLLGGGVLFSSRPRSSPQPAGDVLGAQIESLENELKEPTEQQRELAKADLRGANHLFRGVAGSGKSIILAMNAAHMLRLLTTEPGNLFERPKPPKICVVCFNRTLVHYLRERITAHYKRIAWEAPDETALTVTHFENLVSTAEQDEPRLATGLNFEHKRERAAKMNAAFDTLPAAQRQRLQYDAIYVDEAQDFFAEELQWLARLARPNAAGGRTLILFYDNAQNIYGLMPPVWEKLGINIKGRTVFLDQCFRNTRQTLNLAFNVLVGSFAPAGLRVATRQFADLNNLKQRELLIENNDRVEVLFTSRSGPAPVVQVHSSRQDELRGAAELINHLIHQQHVEPNDILVLYRRPQIMGRELVNHFYKTLGDSCRVHIVDGEHQRNKRLPLLQPAALTISTIASAKGYDAAVVLLVGADDLTADSQGRAAFYVAATRAKIALHVSGIHRAAGSLLSEIVAAAAAMHSSIAACATTASHTPAAAQARCVHCGSLRVNAQPFRKGFIFRCIDCTEATPIGLECRRCGRPAEIRITGTSFLRYCAACDSSELLHTNMPLAAFEQ